ncbi:unnamed protein product [Dibothriocephalus latus]|uniref:C2H2-type domain-containing protein n=1 Tax=Dibothriocephalus latus TaxID=60516 RepID=A0A3P6QHH6_DIBLA|nr:unnamed protein product [Dibothriocephalus latus]
MLFLPSTTGSIFVIGGETAQDDGSTRVDEFIVGERRWRQRAPLADRRQQHSAAVVTTTNQEKNEERALIGVFGGCYEEDDTWINLASCEVYDVSQDSRLHFPHCSHAFTHRIGLVDHMRIHRDVDTPNTSSSPPTYRFAISKIRIRLQARRKLRSKCLQSPRLPPAC